MPKKPATVKTRSRASSARFGVDPRLPVLLAESFHSPEQAIKELVDNAWDADATRVLIALPDPVSPDPIVVEDDGAGMRENELRSHYLAIGRDRRSFSGDFTPGNRRVKGRKGIGKFAGLVLANGMQVESWCRGLHTSLLLRKEDIEGAGRDLERIELPVSVEACAPDLRGTRVTLSGFSTRLAFPDSAKLAQTLITEYGRSDGFNLFINGDQIGIEHLPGESFKEAQDLPLAGHVGLSFTLAEGSRTPKSPGVAIRVGGKIVGKPSFLGLDRDPEIPASLLKHVYGEIDADGLVDDVTGNWAGIIEGSLAYSEVLEWARPQVKERLSQRFRREVKLHESRLKKEIDRRIELLPEEKREYARKHLEKVMLRFWEERSDRIDAIAGMVLDAFDFDDYWTVVKAVEDARDRDVGALADALDAFGLADVAIVGRQARARRQILADLEALALNPDTLEREMHRAIQDNLWVLGREYALISSNETLKRIIGETFGLDDDADDTPSSRPDLLLADRLEDGHLLIEFKRPSWILKRDDESQAVKYRDKLVSRFQRIDILLVGGQVHADLRDRPAPDTKCLTYPALISRAKAEMDWLLKELKG